MAWRWVPDYGAAGAGAACLVTAELVRQRQARSGVKRPLCFSQSGREGAGRLVGLLGRRRRGTRGAVRVCGAVRAGRARGAGSRWSGVIGREKRAREAGSGGGRGTNAGVHGASPLLSAA